MFEEEGIEIVLGSVDRLARDGKRLEATLGDRTITVSHVLLASGRVANTEALHPENAGVETDRGFVVVDDRQRTSVQGIWAAGDVAVGPQLTPIAQFQARIAVDDMWSAGTRRADYSVLPTAIFTDPESRPSG